MNNDLISRENLKNIMKCNLHSWGAQGILVDEVMKTIDSAPTVSDRYDEGFRDGYAQCINDKEERKENSRLFQKGGKE